MLVVTGGAGFIGSVLVWHLNSLGLKDLLLVDHDGLGPAKKNNLKNKKYLDYLEAGDFLKKLSKGAFDGKIKTIFHIGACTDTMEMDKEYLRENNLEYSKKLAQYSVQNNARFLYASSAATYGAGELGYKDDDSLTPKLKPLNPYGESKRLFDLWVLEQGLEKKVAGFKFFNVFGPNEYHKDDMRSVVHKGYQQIKKEGKIRLFKSYRPDYGDGEQERDFVYVKDVVKTMMWFYDHKDKNGIFNLGTGVARNWNDLARSIFQALKLPINIEYIEMPENLRKQYQYHTQADLTKLRGTGYAGTFEKLEDSIADYVLNYLEKPDQYL